MVCLARRELLAISTILLPRMPMLRMASRLESGSMTRPLAMTRSRGDSLAERRNEARVRRKAAARQTAAITANFLFVDWMGRPCWNRGQFAPGEKGKSRDVKRFNEGKWIRSREA